MLDMAFQLLAFFILTFKAPSAETHLDLYLPATPVALPAASRGQAHPTPARVVDTDLENDLLVRAEANDLGDLKALRLGEAALPDLATLGKRLRRYKELLEGRPLRVRLVADDGLRYEPVAGDRHLFGRWRYGDPPHPAWCHAASARRRSRATRIP